ncbi:MAG: glycosyltransferase family 9 protein [Planctomycetes bacterium]|nr:glycosyltransferase family 9 protein [Planctomycetota bacterium]
MTLPPIDWSSVLIGRLSALGDIVFALPVLSSLRAARPDARIGWLVEDRCADLLRGHPWIDELIVYPRGELKGWTRHPLRALRRATAFRRELAARSYDLALELQGNLKCSALLSCVRDARRVGFARSELREPFSACLTHVRVPGGAARRHRVEKMLSVLEALGIPTRREFPPPPPFDEATRERVRAAFAPAAGRPIVAIHPFVSGYGRDKEWPPERFSALARELHRELDAWCYVVRSPKESEPTARLVEGAKGALHDAIPRGTLVDSMAALAEAHLVIGSDSGPLHIAGWLDRPLVGLYGPTDPAVYGPVRASAIVVKGGAEIPPPRKRDQRSPAMLEIGVEQVVDAARRALASARRT